MFNAEIKREVCDELGHDWADLSTSHITNDVTSTCETCGLVSALFEEEDEINYQVHEEVTINGVVDSSQWTELSVTGYGMEDLLDNLKTIVRKQITTQLMETSSVVAGSDMVLVTGKIKGNMVQVKYTV